MSVEKTSPLLIVEDDLALQKQIRWSLDRFETVTAADRESALVQCRRHSPAVVTMDLGLPPDPDSVSEGFKLLAELLALNPDIKVIVLLGSLRATSINRQLAELAVEAAPEGVSLQLFDRLGELPFYNEDIDNDGACSLREALTAVNLQGNYHDCTSAVLPESNVNFAIPPNAGELHTIELAGALPQLTHYVLDGFIWTSRARAASSPASQTLSSPTR